MSECETCNGSGEVQHPRWGSRTCPEPTITCRECGGRGEVREGRNMGDILEDEWEDAMREAGRW